MFDSNNSKEGKGKGGNSRGNSYGNVDCEIT